jgi:hypothetical protein
VTGVGEELTCPHAPLIKTVTTEREPTTLLPVNITSTPAPY